jgi:hypothetical protein
MNNQFIDSMGEAEVANTETGLSFELKNLISITSAEIKDKVNTVAMGVQDGYIDELDALIVAKKGIEFFSTLEKQVRPLAESKGVQKGYVKHNTEISEAMTGVKYDYAHCEDPIWDNIKADMDKLEVELKERQKFLSGISKPTDIVLNKAEVYTIKPPLKTGKLGLKLEIK